MLGHSVTDSQVLYIKKFIRAPSASVVYTSMSCFTTLTRLAYYHGQPEEFIGPRFIILSLKGSIILISLDFFLQREGKLEILLNYKDALTRMLLDFVDIFNMVEILSANECFGVGSFVSEESFIENAIQVFCTISFIIVWVALDINPLEDEDEPEDGDHHSAEQQQSPRTSMDKLYSGITAFSGLCQNLPFFVIRIVVWAQYNLYSLGFLVKNFIVIVLLLRYVEKEIFFKVEGKIKLFSWLSSRSFHGLVTLTGSNLRHQDQVDIICPVFIWLTSYFGYIPNSTMKPVDQDIMMADLWRYLSFCFWYRRLVKFLLHFSTCQCELQRICYKTRHGALRTGQVEKSLRQSKTKELSELVKTANVNIQEALTLIITVKKIKRVQDSVFVDSMFICLNQICGYTDLSLEVNDACTSLNERITTQWGDIGFQGKDPQTDFRGMGVLALDNLLFFASKHTAAARKVLSQSHHPHFWFSYAIAGINITSLALQFLNKGILRSHFYNCKQGRPTVVEFHQVYCYLFFEFSAFWISEEPESVMEFKPS
ncbi:ELMO domain-containing protein 1 [Desmophyllum pertusum]|uniref:ELMO domain-containing protein 1 n=1 Tax=Desmophyllum pertusum TaxID=174260 RepID=A0A9W9YYN3_9CNID|nr:ELMO domain-containing protein 1 [Desmophyllum pertusum]